ncbi:MAG: MSCRAMM family protein, partial [Pyrinomonadaceae bacterium]
MPANGNRSPRTVATSTRLSRLVRGLAVFSLVLLFTTPAVAQLNAPVLLSDPASTRAVALDAITFTPEPFAPTPRIHWTSDRRTRVLLFAVNLALQPGEDVSAVTANAEDAARRRYDLTVENVGSVPGQEWLTVLMLRLHDELGDVGDVLTQVTYRGQVSNRVRLGIGHVGGGPADDPGSGPTPVPPLFVIGGRVLSGVNGGLGGASVRIGGAQSRTVTTDAAGAYAFTVTATGSYTITPLAQFYNFEPPVRAFSGLSGPLTEVNFNAVRQTYAISGRVQDDLGGGLDALTVTLADEAGAALRTVSTSGGGNFTFPGVAAGQNYSVVPTNTAVFDFTSQRVNTLARDLTLQFGGARLSYAIGGQVHDGTHGVGGVTVSLNNSAQTTTDAGGNYSFAQLPAGRNYSVKPSRLDHVFDPSAQVFNYLAGNQRADFRQTRSYTVAGRVTDGGGNGVAGIALTLSGPQTGRTQTGPDGSYRITVTVAGNYTLTPSKEQGYYAFAPASRSIFNLRDNQTANFNADLIPDAAPLSVLEFDGAPKSVDYGVFWREGVDLGHFFWEFWAMPGENAGGTYLLSDGYGGAHALLFGFNAFGGREPGRYQLYGNIFNGSFTNITTFASDEGPVPGEWGHYAVGWDGSHVVIYFNGVPVGRTAFAGPRRTPGPNSGGGWLLIGGSDHNNLVGRIAQVRGYEGTNPLEGRPGGAETAFAPQTLFEAGSGNLLSRLFRPAQNIADLSAGYDGGTHAGRVRSTASGILHDCPSCPLPQFVLDPTAPNFLAPAGGNPPAAPVSSPALPPAGARVFDSFSRPNATYL